MFNLVKDEFDENSDDILKLINKMLANKQEKDKQEKDKQENKKEEEK